MNFVLVLHTHLPYVLGHGRWPHGSDWLMEAAVSSYLPLLERCASLREEGVDGPITLGVTPVLAAQLAAHDFPTELRAFFAQRLAACDDAERELTASHEDRLVPIVHFWRDAYLRGARQFEALDGDLIGALRELEGEGRIELMSSAATHGFLPLLARDESIRLQLFTGRAEHERLFGRSPSGCWLPECAYRPAGAWAPWPGGPTATMRTGIETHLMSAGYRFVVVDAHLARAGRPLEAYHTVAVADPEEGPSSPYRDYVIGHEADAVHALVRDPASTRHVWSRDEGYPGEAKYLEFHKIRFPGGLRLWSVTGSNVSLGDKQPYDPPGARAMAREHAGHFAGLLDAIALKRDVRNERLIVAPFDSELFGHWWFEGPDFLADTYRALRRHPAVQPVTASTHLAAAREATPLDLPAGSWGRNGDFSMWLNPQTAWTWTRLWDLEERFWRVAPAALALPSARTIVAQAARELLLAQASDWQFIISTGEVTDYGERRFRVHADAVDHLVGALERGDDLDAAVRHAEELRSRDSLFPDVLDAVARALDPSPALA
ncbi:MAG: 1,4-alpha-glucan branching protein domain-containing protein [Gemmatimonadales bacterium]